MNEINSATNDIFAELGFDLNNMAPLQSIKEPVVKNPPSTVLPMNDKIEITPVVNGGGSASNQANMISLLVGKTLQEVTALAASGVTKLHNIEIEINNLFVERDGVIKDLIRALTVGHHMLLLGPPGTAKSKLAREICSRIDGGHFFEWLLNRTSDPAEILGPYSIKAMEQDKFLRKVKGKLPEAHIAFIDEIKFIGLLQ